MAKNSERVSASRSRTSASSRSKTNGFSTSSGNPARMTSSVGSKWPSLARQIETRSGCSRSSISPRSTYGAARTSWARAAARSGVLPTTAHRSTSGRSANTRACSRPHHGPVPTTATLVRCSCVMVPPRVGGGRAGRSQSPPAAQIGLDDDDHDQEGAADHLLVVGAEGADLVDEVLDDPEQQHPGQGAGEGAGASAEQRPSDDDGRDRLELQAGPEGGQAGRGAGGDQDAGEAGEHGAGDVDEDLDSCH